MPDQIIQVDASSTPQQVKISIPDTLIFEVTGGTPITNAPPMANAGKDLTITAPADSVSLNGTASDIDGKVVSYLWDQVSGNPASIVSPSSAATTVSGLTAGIYIFRLTVTDDRGATGSDTIVITVNPATTPPPTPILDGYTKIYENGFDTLADIDPDSHAQWGSDSEANHLSTTIFAEGTGSFKSSPSGTVSKGIRSEVQFDPERTDQQEGAIRYKVMYAVVGQNSMHSVQFHPNTDGGSASPGLWHINGKFSWVNWMKGNNTYYDTGILIPKNKWMEFIILYKMGANGYIKHYIDGALVFDKENIQVGDNSGFFFKLGQNMWVNQSAVAYYDGLVTYKKG